MDPKAKKKANLSVLRRKDAGITDILDAASHVVVYSFDAASQQWNKKGVEGTMFVIRRKNAPIFAFQILNRLNLNDLNVNISKELDLETSGEFLIYKDRDETHGLWFYEKGDMNRISNLMNKLIVTSPTPIAPSPQPQESATDLLSLLKKAKQESKSDISPGHSQSVTPTPPAPLPSSIPTIPSQVQMPSQVQIPYPGALSNPMSPYSPSLPSPTSGQPTWRNPMVPMRTIDEMCLLAEALPPAAPRGSLSKVELQGRLVYLLQNDLGFLNTLYDGYLSAPK